MTNVLLFSKHSFLANVELWKLALGLLQVNGKCHCLTKFFTVRSQPFFVFFT